jgi:hypothetical protein
VIAVNTSGGWTGNLGRVADDASKNGKSGEAEVEQHEEAVSGAGSGVSYEEDHIKTVGEVEAGVVVAVVVVVGGLGTPWEDGGVGQACGDVVGIKA